MIFIEPRRAEISALKRVNTGSVVRIPVKIIADIHQESSKCWPQ